MFSHFALLCACPPAAAITDIPVDNCLERWGQLQKFIIQRRKNGTVENAIVDATDDPTLLATWTTLKAAVDSTKVQVSPYMVSVTTEAGEARTSGGGNDSIGGIEDVLGRNPSSLSAVFKDIKQTIVTALKSYECEKELAIIFINESGQLIGRTSDPATNLDFKGFPIRSFFVSDKISGGFDNNDTNNLSWSFLPNWSDNTRIVTPVFDALTVL